MTPTLDLSAAAPLLDVDALASACAGRDPVALFGAIDRYLRPLLGHTLCTVNRFEAERVAVRRLYSSDPRSYPPGGSKDKAGMPWGRHVLLERRVYVGEGEAAIRESFDDHAAIASLGLKSVINVPVVMGDVCLGTLNLLMPAERVTPAMVAGARLGAMLAVPGFLGLRAG
ncbi:GAF domain-containing protein [Bordetella genomosp. 10]|uniref:GAF domain-containing protein n=1 Tax=Bordetella genomosp. 10 TaxID=1416804 RepID=A0A261SC19_9BORD|nr:GAF domain-containing protein [Bordetella genomosp. 10]OZI34537.1 GAF domain-containing protein [Bordetella genomosp. 10]